MKRSFAIGVILLAGSFPLACQKQYSVGPLTASNSSSPTPTSTPNPQLNRWTVPPEPFGITVDGSGNVYINDPTGSPNAAYKYSSAGVSLTGWGSLNSSWGIAWNSVNGYLYFATNTSVLEYTTTGSYIGQWPSPGDGPALAVDAAGNIYDSTMTGVQEFTANGTVITSWGTSGVGPGQFNGPPSGIAVDGSGNVFVTDALDARVEKFSNTGSFLAQWGSSGTGAGKFSYPYGIAVNSAGDVYVVDEGNDNVQKFDNNGVYLAQWGGSIPYLNGPTAMSISPTGQLYIANSADEQVVEIQF